MRRKRMVIIFFFRSPFIARFGNSVQSAVTTRDGDGIMPHRHGVVEPHAHAQENKWHQTHGRCRCRDWETRSGQGPISLRLIESVDRFSCRSIPYKIKNKNKKIETETLAWNPETGDSWKFPIAIEEPPSNDSMYVNWGLFIDPGLPFCGSSKELNNLPMFTPDDGNQDFAVE